MRDEALPFVTLRRAMRVDIVDMGKVGLELLLGQGDDVVDMEQLLSPFVQVWWVCYEFETLELAVVGQWGLIASGLLVGIIYVDSRG